MSEQVISVVRTCVMRQRMVRHFVQNGYRVDIDTRTKVKATQLIAEGAKWMYSIKELSQHSDVLITMVGTPEDVEAVYFGSDGLIENAKQHAYLIDMTTSKPSLAKNIYDIAKI